MFRRLRGGGLPSPRSPPPKAIPTTVPCPGESGNSPDPASGTGLRQIRVSKQLTGIQQRLRLSGIAMSAMHP